MSRPEVEEALSALQRVQKSMAIKLFDRVADHDLSMRQVKALHFVGDCGELSVGALGERLGIKLPAASIQADHLVQAGLIERTEDPEDRRRVRLRLTRRGEEIMAGRREIEATMRRWLEEMPDDDLLALRRGMTRLAEIATTQSPATGAAAPSTTPTR